MGGADELDEELLYSSDEEMDRKWESTNVESYEKLESSLNATHEIERSFNQDTVNVVNETPKKEQVFAEAPSQEFNEPSEPEETFLQEQNQPETPAANENSASRLSSVSSTNHNQADESEEGESDDEDDSPQKRKGKFKCERITFSTAVTSESQSFSGKREIPDTLELTREDQ